MSEHGTRGRYTAGCRCDACRAANTAYRHKHQREVLYGRYRSPYIDAEPVREHVRALRASGIGKRAVCAAAGVHLSWITNLMGTPAKPAPAKVDRANAHRVLQLRPGDPMLLADGALVDACGVHRRIQALVAGGWTLTAQAEACGWTVANWHALLKRQHLTAKTLRTADELYRHWQLVPGPSDRARRMAASRGWAPAFAWDDDTIDNPAARPDLGHYAGRRGLEVEDVQWLLDNGCSAHEAATRLGVSVPGIEQAYRRAGRTLPRKEAA